MSPPALSMRSNKLALTALMTLFTAWHLPALAITDISDVPLVSASSSSVKPNIFFILDDSGSMGRSYMPDDIDHARIGMRNHICNTVYYNPSTSYLIPKNASGTLLNNAAQTTFTNARNNGFDSFVGASSGNTNLSTSFSANDIETGSPESARAAYYWRYVLGGTAPTPNVGVCTYSMVSVTTTTTGICCSSPSVGSGTCNSAEYVTNSPPICTSGRTLVWSRQLVSGTSGTATFDLNGDGAVTAADADERQNFANWFSYYRTRMNMMKSASGRAFESILDNYRVGFMTISPGTYGNQQTSSGAASGSNISASKFLKISDFDLAHRTNWFEKLYSQTTSSFTPLRAALSTAGRYYAGRNDLTSRGMVPTQADDPVQYSCQQNFTILTTDGYWNSGSGRRLDGASTIGNQDGVISELDAHNLPGNRFAVSPRPIYDGAASTYTWNLASNQYRNIVCPLGTALQRRTVQYQLCTNPTTAPSTNYPMARTSSNSGASWGPWFIAPNCTADSTGGSRTECQAGDGLVSRTSSNSGSTWTAWAAHGSAICESDNHGSSRRQCAGGSVSASRTTNNGDSATPTWTAWSSASSCIEDSGGPARRECRYAAVNVNACGGTWDNTQCTNTNPATLPICRSAASAWVDDASCSASSQNASGVATECQVATVSGFQRQYRTRTAATTYAGPNQAGSVLSGPTCSTSSWTNDGTCQATAPALPASGNDACPPVGGEVIGSGPPTPLLGCTAWPCETNTASGGSSGALADVGQYYYKNDLRTPALGNCTGALGAGVNVCDNNVPAGGTGDEDDKANWQHMTTFTMGLGLNGTLTYSPTYKTDTTGTFANLRGGAIDWPVPSADDPTALDDLWHTAVNGRGQYFSAKDPASVVDGLQSALSGITARVASSAAAATSNLEPVAGDNFAYTAKYVTQRWTGELEAREIDLSTGTISGSIIWSAATRLNARTSSACDGRDIKLFRSGATNNLVDFKWNTFACDGGGAPAGAAVTSLNAAERAHFDNSGADTLGLSIDEVATLTQFPSMSDGTAATVNQRSLARGANLVNFLRGQRGKEGFDSGPPATSNDANRLYRSRDSVLGDIISAQPIFVRAPFAEYEETSNPGYAAFRQGLINRTPMVYAGANDGMLHAFRAGSSIVDPLGGEEAWAFIPTMVLPNLYRLATENYDTQHIFTVDGTPTAADVFDRTASADCALAVPTAPANCWKTILVGGLNKGGHGYYALDITDPLDPRALWEFKRSAACIAVDATTKAALTTAGSDCHVGLSFGNPIIGKLANGRWAAFVTSGYNNDDGIGYLYVLDAMTGEIIYRIDTGVGTTANQSGLGKINAWALNAIIDNTVLRVYGVDLLGNIWRFDVNDTLGSPGREATLLAQVVDGTGTPQSITSKPELADVNGEPFVYVASGRFLGTTDLTDTQTQTVWAIRDPLTTTPVSSLRANLGLRAITNLGSGTSAIRTVSASVCEPGEGWFADLPDSGERVNIDIKLQLGTLIVPSNIPSNNACAIGGTSWLNFFDNKTGCAVAGSANASVGTRLVGGLGTESLAVGTSVVRLPDGRTVVIVTASSGEQITITPPFVTAVPVGKRVSWRELVQ